MNIRLAARERRETKKKSCFGPAWGEVAKRMGEEKDGKNGDRFISNRIFGGRR
jgi:hypothetical protein